MIILIMYKHGDMILAVFMNLVFCLLTLNVVSILEHGQPWVSSQTD